MKNDIKSVPNQRILTVNKSKTDKNNKYSVNNLAALDKAARLLESKAGFKLYIYISKNQDKYKFALSSSDFCLWANVGIRAYNTAFDELKKTGYLINIKNNTYMFYDDTKFDDTSTNSDTVEINIPENKVEEILNEKNKLNN